MTTKILDKPTFKLFRSPFCNYFFNKLNGYTEIWGQNQDEDAIYLPDGPMIADIEITTICDGPKGIPCPFCYKKNTSKGEYMTFETFKTIFHKFPRTLTQIAFGADATLTSNPDIWKIMDYCRNNDYQSVVPNITVANISDDVADKLAEYCGAVAVSRYDNPDVCYDSVKRLTDRGMDQVNIHMMVSMETYNTALQTIYDAKDDPRLKDMNAIVFLSLKRKGRGTKYTPLSQEMFNNLVMTAMTNDIKFGFDSCSAHKFLTSVSKLPTYKYLEKMTEPCESTLFSSYIDVKGDFYPCSFCEKVDGWEEGLSVVDCENFLEDIWNHEKTEKFRNNLLRNDRNCPIYDL